MPKLSVRDLPIKGKKIFVRVDFNVPLDENLNITDDTRVRASLPTIKYILENGGIPILASHLGRPKGKIDKRFSLTPVAYRLEQLLDCNVLFAPDCVGDEVKKMVQDLKPGDLLLLENVRFHAEEEKNDPNFSKELAALADLYVDDAFGSAHRAHASVEGIAHHFENPAGGFLMEKELKYLEGSLKNPQRPLLAIMGGAKVSTKIGVIKNLLNKVDNLVIGGGMCFTFLKAKGYNIGTSLCEDEFLDEAKTLLSNTKIYLPVDVVIAKEPKPGNPTRTVDASSIPADYCGVDNGEQTTNEIGTLIQKAKTIVWNGPMGIFEIDEFSKGTAKVAHTIAEATAAGAISIVGGGDTIAALSKFKLLDKVSHASTGGGASLEFLEGKELPGIKVLKEK
ncbi:phosphoglycerate kinase [candidate division TA06 bacterium DG_78]|uniref:Phosphoglycerate kinase n=1 Tax=candidate division TA06 bacterium DG_78 TaxID=1703772 RepID=A0A0S7YH35_UNCT6|nr:MAG: phosphoglycerate kinase [candidate division TA06 bacterium DG_78]